MWVAGGLLKGASVDELVARVAGRLAGAVLIGRDRDVVAKALSRHAPDVPVIHVVTGEDAGVQETSESGVTHVVNVTGAVTGPDIMTAVVGAESFQRLGPIGAVRRGWDRGGSKLSAYAPYQPAPSCHLTNPADLISFPP